ncbi:MAG: hypothetical protein GX814_09055 [Microbacteriaceae bacterium]|nr:hypothetical protein [Microbacteriaceae bacterium]
MSGGSVLRRAVQALIDALTQPSGKDGQSSRKTQADRPRATWRSDTSAAPATYDATESPGQNGTGATRDLTTAEIRALRTEYAPDRDGEPDPGEVVWTWVPYVEYDGRGKDRPVLIIAKTPDGAWAACYLSTKHHRGFVSIGSGAWDSQGRESFLAPERVLRVTSEGMRRESAGIGREHFDRAVAAVKQLHRA